MPKREVVRFDKRGKLVPRYIRHFEILERVGTIAYQLALPSILSGVHEVFHVCMLWKYTLDPAHVVDWGGIVVDTEERRRQYENVRTQCVPPILSYLRMKVRGLVVW